MGKGSLFIFSAMFAFWSAPVLIQPYISVEPTVETPLKIGDRIPDFHFGEVLNYSTPTARLSSLRGRLTILDFWASPCSGCVGLFPHLQKLQDRFHGSLSIVLVDAQATVWHDDKTKVERALSIEGAALGEKISMPVVLNSPELYAAFPYLRVPHEVWIDSVGTVLAFTDAYAVTAENIQKVLSGQHVAFSTKVDIEGDLTQNSLTEILERTPVKIHSPLLSSFVYRGYLFGLGGSGLRRDEQGRLIGFYRVNEQLIDLYGSIFTEASVPFLENKIVVEASHPERFSRSNGYNSLEDAEWYSYDINGSPTSIDSLLTFSQAELNNLFHTKVYTTKRMMLCLVLGMGSSADTIDKHNNTWITDIKDSLYHISGVNVTDWVRSLNGGGINIPVIWDSPYMGVISGDLPLELFNQAEVQRCLKKDGFSFKMENREVEAVVIGDQ